MIRSIEIKGLRGIREGRLDDLTPLVVLVGPNSSGKSTVIDALLIGANSAPAHAVGAVISRHGGVSEGTRWFFWRGDTTQDIAIIVTDVLDQQERRRSSVLSMSVENSDGRPSIWCTIQNKIGDTLSSEDKVGVSFTNINPANYFGNITGSRNGTQIHLVESQSNKSQNLFVDLYSRVVEQGRKQAALSLLADVIPGLVNLEILIEKGIPILYVVFDAYTYSLPVASSGDGIQSLLHFSLELSSRANGVVLLEEPEVHQHPGAIRQTARAIWAAVRRAIQVIISTHSLELIDLLLGEVQGQEELDKMSVYGLMLKDGCLRSSRTQGADIAFARTTIGDDLR
jgi:predicted ATPase